MCVQVRYIFSDSYSWQKMQNFQHKTEQPVRFVMMMFFELFYSETFLSSQAGLEPTTF